jgi:hypothetical protein
LSGAVDRLFKKVHHLLAKEMHLKISEWKTKLMYYADNS